MIQIHSEKLTGATVSGSLSLNTINVEGILMNVIVVPNSDTTDYDISITNSFDANIYERTSETGSMSEETYLPVTGVYTVDIENATADESFLILLIVQTL